MKNKYFYKFLNLNKKILLQENKNNIIIFDRQRFVPSILSCFFSIALAQKYNSNISVYTTNKNSDYIKIFKSFGINKFYYKYFDDWKIIIKSLFIFFPTIFNINKNGIDWFIKKFKINNIFFGDLIYDTYIRFDKSYLNPKLDFKFIKILFLSIIKIEKIYKVFVKSKPKVIISNGGGYATLGGISARIGDNLKIKIITPYIDKKKRISFIDSKNKKCMVRANGDIKRINTKKLSHYLKKFPIKKIEKYIKDRINAKVVTNTTNILDLKKQKNNKLYFSKKYVINKIFKNKKINKLILIAPHAFSDCPHLVGDIFFKDYYNQVYKTLHFINKLNLDNVGWLVRPHPGSKRYGESGIVEKIVKNLKNDYIKLSIKSIASDNLSKICDNVITCTGTVGQEFAIQGKYSINAGKSYYAGLGFSKDHISKKKFYSTLKNINKIPKLNKSQIIIAKKALFYFEYFDKGIPLEKSKIIDNDVINSALKSANKETIFCKKLINNIKKYKVENDEMFKSIKYLI